MPIIGKDWPGAIEEIRKLVSIANDTLDLPTAAITSRVFLEHANLYVAERVPDWQSKTGNDQTLLWICVQKKCAANLLVAFGRVTSESVDDISQSRVQLTPSEAIARYEDDVEKGIANLNSEAITSSRYISAAVVV